MGRPRDRRGSRFGHLTGGRALAGPGRLAGAGGQSSAGRRCHLDRALVAVAPHVHHGRGGGRRFLRARAAGRDAQAAGLDPDPGRHQDADSRLVGNRRDRRLLRGQFRRAQVDQAAALVDQGGVVLRHAPPARPGQAALEGDREPAGPPPGGDRQRPWRLLRQVGGEPCQVRAGLGGKRRPHPLVELGVIDPPLGKGRLKLGGGRVTLGVGRPHVVKLCHSSPSVSHRDIS